MDHCHTVTTRAATLLLTNSLLMAGCSGSGGSPALTKEHKVVNDERVVSGNDTADEQNSEITTGIFPDPLVPNSTQVGFGITAPAYQSDALQVGSTWGDMDVTAETTVLLNSWSGFQIRRAKFGAISSTEKSIGEIKVCFLNETDKDELPGADEIAKLDWLVKYQSQVLENALQSLFDDYSSIQYEWKEIHGNKADEYLPNLNSPEELKLIIGEPSVYIHRKVADQRFYIGISANCSWEQEHGVGWLMLGTEPRIVDSAEVAMTSWMVDQDANKLTS